ncbi:hypothetical protein LTR05_002144 [Lithohypha guttulata]|uniref:MARVEL domain-containing protein n=1 Tax=Lithohypha guttulata TaxID=1690604 RepID=A0AAN7Y7I9_9EURO|nr:hypothetical protein LTR05_002144 [Lithohypha guttulata]
MIRFHFDILFISHILQTVLALIALGLNASVIHYFNTHEGLGSPPGYLVFLVFTSTFTILISIPYTTFAPTYFPAYINRYTSLVIELISTIFWFSGFVAGAVWLGKLDLCAGLICHNARAGVVFAALMFVCYAITSHFPVKYCFFDDENRALGEGNHAMGLSGAERLQKVRLKRAASNNAAMGNKEYSEDSGILSRLMGSSKQVASVVKIRFGNVMQEWRTKAGRDKEERGSRSNSRQTTNRSTIAKSKDTKIADLDRIFERICKQGKRKITVLLKLLKEVKEGQEKAMPKNTKENKREQRPEDVKEAVDPRAQRRKGLLRAVQLYERRMLKKWHQQL